MIGPAEIRDALREMRGELLAAPGASTAPPDAAPASPPRQDSVDPGQALKKIGESMRREKPALASALDKVLAVAKDGEDLVLSFSAKDRFQGEVGQKDKEMLVTRLSALIPGVSRVRLAYREAKADPAKVDQRVELLRKVFRGEVVKGEGHGDQSV